MKFTTFGRPIEILLVEDSATDVMLAEEALEHGKVSNNLERVEKVSKSAHKCHFDRSEASLRAKRACERSAVEKSCCLAAKDVSAALDITHF